MISADRRVIAAVPLFTCPGIGRDAADFAAPFAGATVLGHTLSRLARCEHIERIALVHEPGCPIPPLPALAMQVDTFEVPRLADDMHASRIAARRFAPTAWRGGLGGSTCYDELLATAAIADVMQRCDASAVLLVGPHWPLVDPALCDAAVARHLDHPERLKLVFTQAPPGLAGCVIERNLLIELRDRLASIGALLDYQPRLPQGDPIGKDPCVQIAPVVRNAMVRATFDAPRWQRVLRHVEASGVDLAQASAAELAPLLVTAAEKTNPGPQHITLELTTARLTTGPIVPQHHVPIERDPISLDSARRLLEQAGRLGDVVLTLGGIGDPLLHPQWLEFVAAAADAGIAGIHLHTDLLVDQPVLEQLAASSVEVVSVNVPADTAETYEQLMGVDGFSQVRSNLEWLLNARRSPERARLGLPWVVPRFAKTAQNVEELETFFDRWSYWASGAVIESPTTGAGLMPDLAVIDMSPPIRRPCRQLAGRLTVLTDGRVALCDQDWLGRACLGHVDHQSLDETWARITTARRQQASGEVSPDSICAGCREWHRP